MGRGDLYMDGNVILGYTKFPMERLSYDDEIDLREMKPIRKKDRGMHADVKFDDPVATAEMYRNGATLTQIARQEDMAVSTARRMLVELGVKMRTKGQRKKNAKRWK